MADTSKAERKAERLATGRRLAVQRVNAALDKDRLLGHVAAYGLPSEDVERIIAARQQSLDNLAAILRGRKNDAAIFTL